MSDAAEYLRFWPYGVAFVAGIAFAMIDRGILGRYILGGLLALVAIGGGIGMNLSPFTFHGGDYYIESLIAMLLALAALAGYVLATVGRSICASACSRRAE
jgi:hypothetical protein